MSASATRWGSGSASWMGYTPPHHGDSKEDSEEAGEGVHQGEEEPGEEGRREEEPGEEGRREEEPGEEGRREEDRGQEDRGEEEPGADPPAQRVARKAVSPLLRSGPGQTRSTVRSRLGEETSVGSRLLHDAGEGRPVHQAVQI